MNHAVSRQTDDVRIKEIKELLPPIAHLYELPITERASEAVSYTHLTLPTNREV